MDLESEQSQFYFFQSTFLGAMCSSHRHRYCRLRSQQSDTYRSDTIGERDRPYKDFDLRFAVQWVESATAYGVGEIEAIHGLLSIITSLGKLTRNGWGRISEFCVQEDQDAETRWQWRTLPQWIELQSFENHCPGISTVRPPYWRREFQEPVWEYLG